MKWLIKLLFGRAVFVFLAMTLQVLVLGAIILKFLDTFYIFYSAGIVLSVVVVILILNDSSNPAYKMAWIIPILVFPLFGGLFYVFVGNTRLKRGMRRRLKETDDRMKLATGGDPRVLRRLESLNVTAAAQSRYLGKYSGSPLRDLTSVDYLSTGEMTHKRLLEELAKAERYIFMEYYIIEEGLMWKGIREILTEKASRGVDVRVIYDDIGCLGRLSYRYDRKLEALGIKCEVFNRLKPVLSSHLNHRDHRKITVIDGRVGFTGGINLADEYINQVEMYGHWKDAAVMLRGDGVWNLTTMFLGLWDYLRGGEDDYLRYRPESITAEPDGFVQPFGDSPMDNEPVGENVYLNLISKARKYVYITTPYLVIDNEMLTALSLAAKSGVDVRIITPCQSDTWYVHLVTRSFYKPLVESGVRIYEYTPGFIHSKTFVVDDLYGVVGTINMDFRSLFLHFECGVWMYACRCIALMKEDILSTLEECREITAGQIAALRLYRTVAGLILRVFSPLL